MWLLAGLGNPGLSYAHHRHNAGFMAVDAIAREHGFSAESLKFGALVREGRIGTEKVFLLKPQSYMNLSGQSIGEFSRFYKIPLENIIVFHDELDLPLAKLRVKTGGGHGGHNGLKSIDAHIGGGAQRRLASDASAARRPAPAKAGVAPGAEGAERKKNNYKRVRLGIGHPGSPELVSPYVLSDFRKEEGPGFESLLTAVAKHVPLLLAGDDAGFMNKVTLASQGAKPASTT